MWFKKPIVGVVIFFIAGILGGRYLFSSPSFVLSFYLTEVALLTFAFFAYLREKGKLSIPFIFGGIFLAGTLHFYTSYFPSPEDIVKCAPSRSWMWITGRIINSPRLREDGRKRITFTMQSFWVEQATRDGLISAAFSEKQIKKKVEGKVWVTSFFPRRYYGYGDVVRIRGKLVIPRAAQKKGDFDWQRYLSYQGIWTEVTTGKVEVLEKGTGNPLLHLVFSSKNWLVEKIDKNLPPFYSSILKAILLGEREGLPSRILESFRRTGTAHVLVVSGLHVGLLLFIVFTVVRVSGFSSKIAYGVALPIVIYYAFLSGLRPPIVRATLMATVGIICYFLDRDVPLMIILCLAALIILLVNPLSLFTVSFQLSFLAVGGIVYLVPYLEKKLKRLPEFLRKPFSVSLAAQLSLLPLFAFYFEQFPLIGVVANLIIVPLVTLILGLGFLSLTLATFTLRVAQLAFNTSWLALKGLLFIVNFLSFFWAPRLAQFLCPRVSSPSVVILFLYYALLIMLPVSPFLSFRLFARSPVRD